MRRAILFFLIALLSATMLPRAALSESGEEPAADKPRELSPTAKQIFDKFSPGVVQIKVLERSSGGKSALGSGFFISQDGWIVTNFHVVSEIVFHPERYHAEIHLHDKTEVPAELVAVDVIHDLALLKAKLTPKLVLTPLDGVPEQGAVLFSMGTPHDLELTIVEGIYNGKVQLAASEKLHFTGSVNPGMSGGPALDASGNVVGVNVSGLGSQVSFLVPAQFVRELIATAKLAPKASPLDQAEAQLLKDQEERYTQILATPFPQVELGQYKVASAISPFLRCWSHSDDSDEGDFTSITHHCSPQDHIYLKESLEIGCTHLFYFLYENHKLNRFQFASLLEKSLTQFKAAGGGDREDLSRYRCEQRFVSTNGSTLLLQTCLRAYKKLPSLYDVALTGVSVDSDTQALVTSFLARGVSIEKSEGLVKSFLQGISWNPN